MSSADQYTVRTYLIKFHIPCSSQIKALLLALILQYPHKHLIASSDVVAIEGPCVVGGILQEFSDFNGF